jgi:hypothetical protein
MDYTTCQILIEIDRVIFEETVILFLGLILKPLNFWTTEFIFAEHRHMTDKLSNSEYE